MLWQDIVIALANVLFTYSLFNQVVHGYLKKRGFITKTTSGLTAFGLYAVTIAFLTLHLYISSCIAAVSATLWLILFVQGIVYKKA